jgi:hypothetical protein
VVLTVAAYVLVAAVYQVLGIMAVPQIVAGAAAPGVYVVPEPGVLIILAGIVAAVAASLRAW